MAQALLDFFDEDYFSQACTCEGGSNVDPKSCEIHGKTTKPVSSKHGPRNTGGGVGDVPQVDINQSFPRQPAQEHLAMMIEYRIRVLSNHPTVIKPGEIIPIQTNINVTRKAGKLSLLLKSSEGLPLRLSEGLINPAFRGSLSVYFGNPTSVNVHLPAGSNVAYLILSPFIK